MSQVNADRNLLLGILAYQNAFVSRDALLAGLQAWLQDKSRSLAAILEEHGAIDAASRELLEAIAAKHMQQHGGDPARSLQAVNAAHHVGDELRQLPDADVQASLAHLQAPVPRRHRALAATAATAALLLVASAIAVAWLVQQQRAAAEAQTAQVVNQAMGQANALREQAHNMLPGDADQQAREAALWRDAMASGERVQQALTSGAANAETRDAAEAMLVALRDEDAEAARDRQMLRSLDAALTLSIELQDSDYVQAKGRMIVRGQKSAQAFARAFADYGIDLDALAPAEAADRISKRRIKEALTAALDHWNFVEPTAAHGKLLDVANGAVDDPLARRARDAIMRKDSAVMKELATDDKVVHLPTATLLLLVESMHQAGLHAEGLDLIQRAQRQRSGDFWIQDHTGIYLAQGPRSDWPDATRAYTAAITIRPRSHVAWANLGAVLMELGDCDGSITALRRSIELNPNYTTAINRLSAALIQNGEAQQALAVVEKALTRLPDSPMLVTAVGNALRRVGRTDDACAAYQRALVKEPRWFFAQEQLAEIFAQQGDKVKALELLDRAQQVQPTRLNLYLTRWRVHNMTGDHNAAVKAGAAAVACKPQSDVAHHALATALYNQQRVAEAAAEYRIAARLAPTNALGLYNLGSALVDNKQFAEALVAFEGALHWHADRPLYHNGVGESLMHQKQYGEAIGAFQKAIALDPKSADNHSNLSRAYYLFGDHARAESEAAEAIRLDPMNAIALGAMGNSLFSQGRHADAIPYYQKALAITPTDGVIQMNLGRSLYRGGDFVQGHKALTSAVQTLPADSPNRPIADKELKECEHLLALDKQIEVFRATGALPKTAKGTFELADVAWRYKQHHNMAVALYSRVFTPEANVLDDLIGDHRYRAACSALLTAAGKAVDLPKPSAGQKSQRREQALGWLRAELDYCTKSARAGKSEDTPRLIERLARWKTARELESLRDPDFLDKLSAEEKMAWRELWDDAELFVNVARARILQIAFQGTLTPAARSQGYELNAIAGKTYVIDLAGKGFDPLLKVMGEGGKLLAEEEDVSPDSRNARVVFTAPSDGVYRVVATSTREAGIGPYTLRIGAVTDGK
jgi:tetratricopeptide (TPR) repeat protein